VIQDAHTKKISLPVVAPIGTTIVIAANPNAWIYVHELIGDLAANGTLDIKCGSTTVASFTLDMGQGITEQDEAGEDNRPRFECKPGDAFSLVVTGGTFNGAIHFSYRY
jgi:hypothetical protein